MNAASVGKMVALLRKKNKMTQAELAEKLGISDKTVSKWENGAGFPDVTFFPQLASLFHVTVDYLMNGEVQGIAIAGNILVDIIKHVDTYPKQGMLANIRSMQKAVGGCVPNTIIDLAKIDPALFLSAYGKVGSDENGQYVVSKMQRYGIDVSGIRVSDEGHTSFSDVITDMENGERTFFHERGTNGQFDIADIPLNSLNCRIFHIGYALLLDTLDGEDEQYGTKMARLLHEVQKRGILTSLDVVSDSSGRFKKVVTPSLKYCDFAIMNEIEACSISELSPRDENGKLLTDNIRSTMETLLACGVQKKVVVHCPEMGFLMDKNGQFTAVPSVSLPQGYIKGSVGAGDAFCAAVLYGIYKGYSDQKILEFASLAAACNLSAPDSISGMRPKEEIEKLETQFQRRNPA